MSRQDEEEKAPRQQVVRKIKADYQERGLDLCHFCGLKFNVGERIPRIIVGCGHTFCTSCLSYFLRNGRIRCPMCRKLLKHVESVDKLPLNFNILYEIVTKDPLLSRVNFEKCLNADPDMYHDDAAYERDFAPYMCQKHEQRIKHFYCSEHPSIFCRECIKDMHNLEACFVVDLYEIEKMRKLQQQNNELNRKQLKRRQDGATDAYVVHPDTPARESNPLQISETLERRPRHEPLAKTAAPVPKPSAQPGYFQPQRFLVQQAQKPSMVPVGGNSAIVEFDATQFDGQGFSSQQMLAAQHHHMLMTAGQKQFPSQQNYGYGKQHGQDGQDEASFSETDDEDDENGEEEEDNSDYEDRELNSAQKQKLKRDLMMMGYGQNGEFGDDDDDDDVAAQAYIAGSAASAAADQAQLQFLQQMQFEEAMRIQMAMKQMPFEDKGVVGGALAGEPPVGLRVKKNVNEVAGGFDLGQHVLVQAQPSPARVPLEDELTQQQQFKLDKQLFAQQMKQQLYGKPQPSEQAAAASEERKGVDDKDGKAAQVRQIDDKDDEEESFNSQIIIGEAELEGERQNEDSEGEAYQTPPMSSKQEVCAVGGAPATQDAALAAHEQRKSLTERSQNNDTAANQVAVAGDGEVMKENAAPAEKGVAQ